MNSLKVLILGGNFSKTGGTERVGCMLANGLSEAGYEVMLASISLSDESFFPINKDIKILKQLGLFICLIMAATSFIDGPSVGLAYMADIPLIE